MNQTKLCWTAAIAAIALAVSACAGTATQRTAGEVVDDVTLLGRVKTALIQSPDAKARDIDVEVRRGEVQLNGFVDSAETRSQAAKIASQVDGVQSVRNNLQVQSEPRTGGQVVDDTIITTRVKAALMGDTRTKSYQIEVTTRMGEVQLGGFVDTREAKQVAAELASRVAGVKSVENGLEVKN
jgi:hyperosmotically inducible periplasmic protein